jgi:hypothetical protein
MVITSETPPEVRRRRPFVGCRWWLVCLLLCQLVVFTRGVSAQEVELDGCRDEVGTAKTVYRRVVEDRDIVSANCSEAIAAMDRLIDLCPEPAQSGSWNSFNNFPKFPREAADEHYFPYLWRAEVRLACSSVLGEAEARRMACADLEESRRRGAAAGIPRLSEFLRQCTWCGLATEPAVCSDAARAALAGADGMGGPALRAACPDLSWEGFEAVAAVAAACGLTGVSDALQATGRSMIAAELIVPFFQVWYRSSSDVVEATMVAATEADGLRYVVQLSDTEGFEKVLAERTTGGREIEIPWPATAGDEIHVRVRVDRELPSGVVVEGSDWTADSVNRPPLILTRLAWSEAGPVPSGGSSGLVWEPGPGVGDGAEVEVQFRAPGGGWTESPAPSALLDRPGEWGARARVIVGERRGPWIEAGNLSVLDASPLQCRVDSISGPTGRFVVDWGPVGGSATYALRWSRDGEPVGALPNLEVAGSTTRHEQPVPWGRWEVRVEARTDDGTGFSSGMCGSVSVCPPPPAAPMVGALSLVVVGDAVPISLGGNTDAQEKLEVRCPGCGAWSEVPSGPWIPDTPGDWLVRSCVGPSGCAPVCSESVGIVVGTGEIPVPGGVRWRTAGLVSPGDSVGVDVDDPGGGRHEIQIRGPGGSWTAATSADLVVNRPGRWEARVRAVVFGEAGPWSPVVGLDVVDDAPLTVSAARSGGDSQVRVDWSPSPGADRYQLRWWRSDAEPPVQPNLELPRGTTEHLQVLGSGRWRFAVTAVAVGGEALGSGETRDSVDLCPPPPAVPVPPSSAMLGSDVSLGGVTGGIRREVMCPGCDTWSAAGTTVAVSTAGVWQVRHCRRTEGCGWSCSDGAGFSVVPATAPTGGSGGGETFVIGAGGPGLPPASPADAGERSQPPDDVAASPCEAPVAQAIEAAAEAFVDWEFATAMDQLRSVPRGCRDDASIVVYLALADCGGRWMDEGEAGPEAKQALRDACRAAPDVEPPYPFDPGSDLDEIFAEACR